MCIVCFSLVLRMCTKKVWPFPSQILTTLVKLRYRNLRTISDHIWKNIHFGSCYLQGKPVFVTLPSPTRISSFKVKITLCTNCDRGFPRPVLLLTLRRYEWGPLGGQGVTMGYVIRPKHKLKKIFLPWVITPMYWDPQEPNVIVWKWIFLSARSISKLQIGWKMNFLHSEKKL